MSRASRLARREQGLFQSFGRPEPLSGRSDHAPTRFQAGRTMIGAPKSGRTGLKAKVGEVLRINPDMTVTASFPVPELRHRLTIDDLDPRTTASQHP